MKEPSLTSVGSEAYDACDKSLNSIVADSGAKLDKESLLKRMTVLTQGGDKLADDLDESIKDMEEVPSKLLKRITVDKESSIRCAMSA